MKNLAYELKLNQKNIYTLFYYGVSVIDVMTSHQILRTMVYFDVTYHHVTLHVIIETLTLLRSTALL